VNLYAIFLYFFVFHAQNEGICSREKSLLINILEGILLHLTDKTVSCSFS